MIAIIIQVLILLTGIYFLFSYVEKLSIIFCVGLERYRKIIKINTFSLLEISVITILSVITSAIVYKFSSLKIVYFVIGYGMVLGIIKSWVIRRYSK